MLSRILKSISKRPEKEQIVYKNYSEYLFFGSQRLVRIFLGLIFALFLIIFNFLRKTTISDIKNYFKKGKLKN
jgi:hypothetical protein